MVEDLQDDWRENSTREAKGWWALVCYGVVVKVEFQAPFGSLSERSFMSSCEYSSFSCWAMAWAETISARRFKRGVWSPNWQSVTATKFDYDHNLQDGVYVSNAVMTRGSAISYGPLSSISTAVSKRTSLFSVTREATAFMISPLMGCS